MSDNSTMVYDFIDMSSRVTMQDVMENLGLSEDEVRSAFKELKAEKKLVTYRNFRGVTFSVQLGLDRSLSRNGE